MAAIVTTPVVVAINSTFSGTYSTITASSPRYASAPGGAPTVVSGVTRLVPTPAYKRWNGTTWVTVFRPS